MPMYNPQCFTRYQLLALLSKHHRLRCAHVNRKYSSLGFLEIINSKCHFSWCGSQNKSIKTEQRYRKICGYDLKSVHVRKALNKLHYGTLRDFLVNKSDTIEIIFKKYSSFLLSQQLNTLQELVITFWTVPLW